MASAVATPLERQFSKIAGITQMTSVSTLGNVGITMQFDLSRDVNGAARDVQAAINAARSQLPANLPSNPSYRKINPSDAPILILSLTSDTLSTAQLYDASDSVLAQKIAQVQGVGQVFTGGSAKPAVRVEADPNLLSSYGIGLEALRTALGQVNVNQPTGYLTSNDQRYSVTTSDQLFGAAAYAPLIVATNRGPVSSATASSGLPASVQSAVAAGNSSTAAATNPSSTAGASTSTITANPGSSTNHPNATAALGSTASGNVTGTVRVRDVAKVINSVEDIHTGGLFNGKPAILIIVTKTPGANVISTVDKVLAILPQLRASISPAINLQVALDRTVTIRASVKDVTRTLIISIVLVILVVFVFLREVRSTLIPSVSVPLSILGTFGVMYLLATRSITCRSWPSPSPPASWWTTPSWSSRTSAATSRWASPPTKPPWSAPVRSASPSSPCPPRSSPSSSPSSSWEASSDASSASSPSPSRSPSWSRWSSPSPPPPCSRPSSSRPTPITSTAASTERASASCSGSTTSTPAPSAGSSATSPSCWGSPLGTFVLTMYLFTIVPKGFFPQQDTGRIGGQIRAQQDTSFDDQCTPR